MNSPMVELAPGESYAMDTQWYPTRMGEDFKTTTYSGVIGTPLTATATPCRPGTFRQLWRVLCRRSCGAPLRKRGSHHHEAYVCHSHRACALAIPPSRRRRKQHGSQCIWWIPAVSIAGRWAKFSYFRLLQMMLTNTR